MTLDLGKVLEGFLNAPTFLGFAILVFVVVVVLGLQRGWWVSGYEYQRVVDAAAVDKTELHAELARKQTELERWQDEALRLARLAETTTRRALDAMELLPPRADLGEPPRYPRGGPDAWRS